MSLVYWIDRLVKSAVKKQTKPTKRGSLTLQQLEDRVVPYSVTGNAWVHPNLITISFVPDGTPLSSAVGTTVTSNLFSKFNAKFGSAAAWQNQILKAAQVWAQQTNINFSVVSDSGTSSGSGSYQQGNPSFGDIRIGGYVFGNSTLAVAYQPPQVNNYSIAGDIAFNTGQTFNIGSTYDLFTVATHEFGHALGLNHTSAGTSSVMYASYAGVRSTLSSDDIAGIRNIYSSNAARANDANDTGTSNNTLATAKNLTSLINSTSLTALTTAQNIATTSDIDWYQFTAPAGTTGTMKVQVQSKGLSLLAPKVMVYAADGVTLLGSSSGLNHYGTTLTVSINGVSAGQKFYARVQGADTSAFGTGAFALALNFGSGATPLASSPNTLTANGAIRSGGGGVADTGAEGDSYLNNVPLITGITPDNGFSRSDLVTNARNIKLVGSAPEHNTINVYTLASNGTRTLIGTTVVGGGNDWTFDYTGTSLSQGTYTFTATATDLEGNVSDLANPVTVRIDTTTPAKPDFTSISPDTGFSATDEITQSNTPTLQGTAPANSLVQIYKNSNSGVFGSTMTDSYGKWWFQTNKLDDGTYSFTATSTNLAGTVSILSSSFAVTIDTRPPSTPAITGISHDTGTPGDGATNDPTIHLMGTADPNNRVQVFNGGFSIGTTTSDGSGKWQFDYSHTTLAEGMHSFTAQSAEVAGNVSSLSQSYTVVIALTPPVVPTVTGMKTDSGISATDCITNVQGQIFSGTSIAHASVEVFLDDRSLGTVPADDGGNWSFDDSADKLTEGSHAVKAQVTDYVGNVSALSAPMIFVIDLTAPSKPIITHWSPDSGASAADGITNVNTPTISGTAEANSKVTVLDGGHPLGTAMTNAVGVWQYTSAPLSDGVHSITTITTDVAGNTSSVSLAISFTIDTTAPQSPALTGITPDSGLAGDEVTNNPNIKLLGTATANMTVRVFNNGTPIGTTTANSSGAWTFDYSKTTLPAGSYSFTTQAVDLAGNCSQASKLSTVVIALTAPAAPAVTALKSDSGVSATDGITNVQAQVFSGTGVPNNTVQLFLDSKAIGTTTSGPDGKWSLDYSRTNITAGTHAIAAQVTDYVGNVSALSAALTFVVDLTAPYKPILSSWGPDTGVSATDGVTKNTTPTMYGTAEPSSVVTVLDNGHALGTVTANAVGAWQFTFNQLGDGVHAITATVTDIAGNTGQASSATSMTVDTKIGTPQLSGITPDNGPKNNDAVTNAQKINITGNADANATVQVFLGSVSLGTTKADSSGKWTFNNTAMILAVGSYQLTAVASDAAGNVSPGSQTLDLVIDLTAPAAPPIASISKTTDGSGNQILVLRGTSEANSQVTVYLAGVAIGTANADGQGKWTFNDKATTFANGTYLFTASAMDLAGNVSAQSTFKLLLGNGMQNLSAPKLDPSSVLGVAGNGNPIAIPTPTFTGNAKAGTLVTLVDGNLVLGTVLADANGHWSFTSATLANGKHCLSVFATDALGNSGLLSDPLTFEI